MTVVVTDIVTETPCHRLTAGFGLLALYKADIFSEFYLGGFPIKIENPM